MPSIHPENAFTLHVPDIYSILIIFSVDGNQIKAGELVDTLVRK